MNRDEVTHKIVKAMKHHNFMTDSEFDPITDEQYIDRAYVLILMSLELLGEQPREYYSTLLTKALFPQYIIDDMMRDSNDEKFEMFY